MSEPVYRCEGCEEALTINDDIVCLVTDHSQMFHIVIAGQNNLPLRCGPVVRVEG